MLPNLTTLTATIAEGQSVSDVVDLTTKDMVMIIMPPQWSLAAVSFQISLDGSSYYNLYYATTGEVLLPVIAGAAILVPKELSGAFNYLKFRSGSAASPVTQTAARQFGIATTQ